jgi:hypothetical protein
MLLIYFLVLLEQFNITVGTQIPVNTKEEIEDSIKDNLPILFRGAEEVDRATIAEKHNAFIDYLITASAPSLSTETSRYQSIVLCGSVFLLFVKFTHIFTPKPATVTIFGIITPLNGSLVAIYSVFLAVVVGFSLIKAWVDIERVRFSREKNKNSITDLVALFWGGFSKRYIQIAFWLKISDAIGRSYKVYDDVVKISGDSAALVEDQESSNFPLDLDSLQQNPVCAVEISRLETYLANINEDLAAAEKRFCQLKAAPVITDPPDEEKIFVTFKVDRELKELWEKNQRLEDDIRADDRIREAYEATLEPWVEARIKLSIKALKFVAEMSAYPTQLERMKKALSRLVVARWISFLIEVVAPTFLAGMVIVYVLAPASK